jgi:hypothetical protein
LAAGRTKIASLATLVKQTFTPSSSSTHLELKLYSEDEEEDEEKKVVGCCTGKYKTIFTTSQSSLNFGPQRQDAKSKGEL